MKDKTPNIYKIGYNLVTSLDYNHPENSIDKALKVLMKRLKADSALLFKKNEDNKFNLISASNDLYNSELQHIINIYNRRRKRDFDVDLNDKTINRLMILNIPINDELYALAVTNGYSLNDNKESIKILKKSISNIIINSELIYKLRNLVDELKELSVTDKMTSVANRLSYDQDIQKLLEEDDKLVTFIMTDLFRLKHINDTYGHNAGDKYIKETAYILQDTFDDNNSKVYRIGGDEFVIIRNNYDIIDLENKISIASKRVQEINVGTDETLLLNYGISVGSSQNIGSLSKEADSQLSINKELNYKRLKIDRRL